MTFKSFDAYWAANGIETNPPILGAGFREIAEKAWNAAIEAADDACWTKRDVWEEATRTCESDEYNCDYAGAAEELGAAIRQLSTASTEEISKVAPKPASSPFAYPTLEDYEKIAGFKTNFAFQAGWTMARTTEKMLGIETAFSS
jgi:hypothetical protein